MADKKNYSNPEEQIEALEQEVKRLRQALAEEQSAPSSEAKKQASAGSSKEKSTSIQDDLNAGPQESEGCGATGETRAHTDETSSRAPALRLAHVSDAADQRSMSIESNANPDVWLEGLSSRKRAIAVAVLMGALALGGIGLITFALSSVIQPFSKVAANALAPWESEASDAKGERSKASYNAKPTSKSDNAPDDTQEAFPRAPGL